MVSASMRHGFSRAANRIMTLMRRRWKSNRHGIGFFNIFPGLKLDPSPLFVSYTNEPFMSISVIIPTLNEAKTIGALARHLRRHGGQALREVIVVDGGSHDGTLAEAAAAGAAVLRAPARGRAIQMNHGARQAKGDILYFVHADTIPPASFAGDILAAAAAGKLAGCYRFRFDSHHSLMRVNAYFTRFPFLWCRGGDQSLFISRELFFKLGGFAETYPIMEDFEFIRRLRKTTCFEVLKSDIIVSARKYRDYPYWRVQAANFAVFNLFRLGADPYWLARAYRRMLPPKK
jgi:rSAM/selenodomain-associated transferase 2